MQPKQALELCVASMPYLARSNPAPKEAGLSLSLLMDSRQQALRQLAWHSNSELNCDVGLTSNLNMQQRKMGR